MSGAEIKAGARKLLVENAPRIFFISIIFVFVTTLISELQFRLPGTSAAYELFLEQVAAGEIPRTELFYLNLRPAGVALMVILWLMLPIIEVGFASYCLKTTRGQASEYKDMLDGFLFFFKVIIIRIVTTVLTLLWSILFFFPGIVAHYRYRQAYYILLDDPKKGALQCIQESKRMMQGNKLELFLLDLSFIGWNLLSLVIMIILPIPFSFPIVDIWLSPYIGLSRAVYYNNLLSKLAV